MKRISLQAVLGGLAGFVLLTGCHSSSSPPPPPKMGPAYSFVIKADRRSLDGAKFQVDFLKLNSSTERHYENVAISNYFRPGSSEQLSAPLLQSYMLTPDADQRFDLTDMPTVRYPSYSYIEVLANPPGDVVIEGKEDPRRKLIPLDINKWPRKWPGKEREITITITAGGVQVEPGWLTSSP